MRDPGTARIIPLLATLVLAVVVPSTMATFAFGPQSSYGPSSYHEAIQVLLDPDEPEAERATAMATVALALESCISSLRSFGSRTKVPAPLAPAVHHALASIGKSLRGQGPVAAGSLAAAGALPEAVSLLHDPFLDGETRHRALDLVLQTATTGAAAIVQLPEPTDLLEQLQRVLLVRLMAALEGI